MRLIEAEQRLLALKQPVLQTSDASACLQVSRAYASKILDRLVKEGRFVRLMRGKWATSQQIDPLILPEHLTAPFPSYVSLQTALFYHGMISQIPEVIYAVTVGRTRQYKTPLGTFSVHHLQPNFFFDFEIVGNVKIATLEKALIDVLYLTAAKSQLFKVLPELEFPTKFNRKKAYAIIKRISFARTRTLVTARLNQLLSQS